MGGTSIIPYTDRFFKEKIQTDIEYFNPFRNVEIDPQVSREELARCAHFSEKSSAWACKTTECPIEVNLLPKSARRREQMQHQRPNLAGAAVCILLIPLCWLGYTQKTLALKTAQLQELTDKVKNMDDLSQRLNREQDQLSEVQGKANQIVSLVDQRSLWRDCLQDLTSRVSSNIWIVSFIPDSDVPAVARAFSPVVSTDVRSGDAGRATKMLHRRPGPGGGIAEVRIEGAGIHSAENPEQDIQLVDDFAKNLRESPFYDKAAVVIDVPPNPTLQRKTFTFTIRAKLLKPISL